METVQPDKICGWECVCVAQQILRAATMKSFFFFSHCIAFVTCFTQVSCQNSLASWKCDYRCYTHSRENFCTRGTGCCGQGRVYTNPSTAGHLSEASKATRRHGAIKSISESSPLSSAWLSDLIQKQWNVNEREKASRNWSWFFPIQELGDIKWKKQEIMFKRNRRKFFTLCRAELQIPLSQDTVDARSF